MNELFGFLSVDELAGAIAAWREMEKRVRGMYGYDVRPWLLEPLDALDSAAGMKAIGHCKNCGADLANPDNCGDGKTHTEKDCIVKLRREIKTVRAIYFKAMGEGDE